VKRWLLPGLLASTGARKDTRRVLSIIKATIAAERSFPYSGAGLASWVTGCCQSRVRQAPVPCPLRCHTDQSSIRSLIAALLCTRSIQNSSTVLRDRFSVAGAKDDRRDAYVLGDGVRTDRRLFHRLQGNVASPMTLSGGR
jgi:hypothetical protein